MLLLVEVSFFQKYLLKVSQNNVPEPVTGKIALSDLFPLYFVSYAILLRRNHVSIFHFFLHIIHS